MQNSRIRLRPWREEDAERLFELASDPEIGFMGGWQPHSSVSESRKIIQDVFINPTTWAVELKASDTIIGAIGYGPSCDCSLPARENEPTVGYWIGKPYWGQGFCTEALRMMIETVRNTTDIKSLISGHFADNLASGRVMEKCGFKATGETVFDNDSYAGKDRPIRVLRLDL